MKLEQYVSALALVTMAAGCVVIEGPIIYSNTGGSAGAGAGGAVSHTIITAVGGSGGDTTGTPTPTTTWSESTSNSESSSTGTGGGGGGLPCSAPVSDEFSDPTPSACWQILEPARFNGAPSIYSGELMMRPASATTNGWFGNSHGPFFFQEVTGDFIFVTSAFASLDGGPGAPTKDYNIAGLLARDPASMKDHENWALIDIGQQVQAWDGVGLGRMVKTTHDSVTVKSAESSDLSFHATLGICRQGSTLTMLYRIHPSGQFTQFTPTASWPSLPPTLQVGLISGTWVENPDVVSHFEYARFGVVAPQDTCFTAFQKIAVP